MGLDQWCYSCDAADIPDGQRVDFPIPEGCDEIMYWRKHPDIHGWMENLYFERGGENPDFNCANVELTIDDLDSLEIAVKEKLLPRTVGFFFGQSSKLLEEEQEDLAFIRKAKELILNEDKRIFYTSWW